MFQVSAVGVMDADRGIVTSKSASSFAVAAALPHRSPCTDPINSSAAVEVAMCEPKEITKVVRCTRRGRNAASANNTKVLRDLGSDNHSMANNVLNSEAASKQFAADASDVHEAGVQTIWRSPRKHNQKSFTSVSDPGTFASKVSNKKTIFSMYQNSEAVHCNGDNDMDTRTEAVSSVLSGPDIIETFTVTARELRSLPNKKNHAKNVVEKKASSDVLFCKDKNAPTLPSRLARYNVENNYSSRCYGSDLPLHGSQTIFVDLTENDEDDASSSSSLKLSHSSPTVRQLFSASSSSISPQSSEQSALIPMTQLGSRAVRDRQRTTQHQAPITVVNISEVAELMSGSPSKLHSAVLQPDSPLANYNIFDTTPTTLDLASPSSSNVKASTGNSSTIIAASLSPTRSSAPSTPSTPHKIQVLDYDEEDDDEDDNDFFIEMRDDNAAKPSRARMVPLAGKVCHQEQMFMSPTTATDIGKLSMTSPVGPANRKLFVSTQPSPARSRRAAAAVPDDDNHANRATRAAASRARGRPRARGRKRLAST